MSRLRPGARRVSTLTASSEIALRAFAYGFRQRDQVGLAEIVTTLKARFPILGMVAERRDIALAMRAAGFLRDHARRDAIVYRNAR